MLIVAGLLVAVLSVLLVLEPVLRAGDGRAVVPLFSDSDDEDDPVQRRRDLALAAIKEIEFDHATGKLSDADFERLIAAARAQAKGKKFCIECGSPLEGSGRFCVECGSKVAA